MTAAQELELLVAEQRRDDTHVITPQRNTVSLDKQHEGPDGGSFTLHDIIGVEDGEIVVPGVALVGVRRLILGRSPLMGSVMHGSASTYGNHGCRCAKCRQATTEKHRDWYARNRKRSPEVLQCAWCEQPFERNQFAARARFCSKRCKDAEYDSRRNKEHRNQLDRARYAKRKVAA